MSLLNFEERIPGASLILEYIQSSYQNDPFRSLLEVLLVAFMVWYFVAKRYAPGTNEVELTPKEIQQLIDEWEPEPLVKPLTDFQRHELEKPVAFSGPVGLKAKGLDGRERFNFASLNFLGVMNSDAIKEKAIEALRKYGVGTCGPPGFYGTLDVHLELENRLATFLGAEAAIIYSQGFSCVSSVIPAFAKRGDIILADEAVSFATQKGLQISRSIVKYFKHNDMEDLERLILSIEKDKIKRRAPLTRQFIVVEGVYANVGDICPLVELVAIKEKHKYRLLIEESFSIGALGVRGAGVSDHFGVDPSKIDLIVASMSNALGSSGGFCAGSLEIIEHQRLSGPAFVYSASLPAMLAVAAMEGLKFLEAQPEAIARLLENSERMGSSLKKLFEGAQVKIDGAKGSPIFHIRLDPKAENREDDERYLQEVVDLAAKDSIILTRAKYVVNQERDCPSPSIRVAISAGFNRKEVERAASVIRDCFRRVQKKKQGIYF